MSIVRDYKLESELALLKWLGEAISDLEKLLDSPAPAATAVTSTPQDEGVLAGPRTAGPGCLSDDTQ